MKLQRLGGYASIILIGITIVLFAAYLYPGLPGTLQSGDTYDPVKLMKAEADAPSAFRIFFAEIHVGTIFYSILIILIALSLQERMQASAPNLMRLAVIAIVISSALTITFAIAGSVGHSPMISAQDVSAYKAFLVMLLGLSAAANHIGGWGMLLIGWVGFRTRSLPRLLSCFILASGVLSVFGFANSQVDAINTVLFLISFLWLGVVLLRKPEPGLA